MGRIYPPVRRVPATEPLFARRTDTARAYNPGESGRHRASGTDPRRRTLPSITANRRYLMRELDFPVLGVGP